MVDAPITPPIPSLAQSLLHDFAQKALTTAATALLAHGALTQVQGQQFVEVGVALSMYFAGCLWTVAAAWYRRYRERALQVGTPPKL